LLLVATFFEAFMVKNLPLVFLAVVGVIPLALFSFYDFKSGQLKLSKESVLAIILVGAGLLITQI